MLRRQRRCAWPGCKEKPIERGKGGMCSAHIEQRNLDELASRYFDLAADLERHAERAAGQEESVPWDPPGPIELRRLARQSRQMAKAIATNRQLANLPERRRGEVPVDPAKLPYLAARNMDPIVQEGILELWPGRPSNRTPITQDEWTVLRNALGVLSFGERKAFWLVKGQGYSHGQAAREMGLDRRNIYTLLHRAEEKLAALRGAEPAIST